MKFLSLAFLLLVTITARAEQVSDCAESGAFKYCISKTVGSKSQEVIYLLHGGGGHEKVWRDHYSELRSLLEKKTADVPAVISVSFGQIWLLVKKSENPRSGLLELFTQTIMPKMEKLALGGPAKRRYLLGNSMGGFNGAQLVLHSPVGTFHRAALLCPAFVDITPFASEAEKVDLAQKLNVPFDAVQNIADIAAAFVPNNEVWFKEVSPIDLAAKKLGTNSTELLVAGNKEDNLFLSGGEKFAAVARAVGAPVRWELWEGDHCAADEKSTAIIADFLTH